MLRAAPGLTCIYPMWPTFRTLRQAALAWAIGSIADVNPVRRRTLHPCSARSRWPGAPLEQRRKQYRMGQKGGDKFLGIISQDVPLPAGEGGPKGRVRGSGVAIWPPRWIDRTAATPHPVAPRPPSPAPCAIGGRRKERRRVHPPSRMRPGCQKRGRHEMTRSWSGSQSHDCHPPA